MSLGCIQEFKIHEEDFGIWVERLEFYMLLNGIKKNKKFLFLVLIGNEGYKLLKALCSPELPKHMKYDKLVSILKNYLPPKVSVLVELYKSRVRQQEDNDAVTKVTTKLEKLNM